MIRTIVLLLAATIAAASPATATDASQTEPTAVERWQEDPTTIFDASEVDIDAFKWIARPIVVFADTPADPSYVEQLANFAVRMPALVERDVVIITDTDPDARTDLRRKLRPRGFMFAIIGKDGGVKLRKPFAWSVREITRSIDKMPIRQQEMRGRIVTE